jgi:hypothetical protein
MHDGYLFTLGVCGSASDSGPAPACLDGMLAALPPVKRAAYLGEILLSQGPASLDDPLTAPLLADIADAELLLIVTPLPGGALPARLRALARAIAAAPPSGARLAAIVAIGDGGDAALRGLRQALSSAGATVVGELQAPGTAEAAELVPAAAGLARAAYALARERSPGALP